MASVGRRVVGSSGGVIAFDDRTGFRDGLGHRDGFRGHDIGAVEAFGVTLADEQPGQRLGVFTAGQVMLGALIEGDHSAQARILDDKLADPIMAWNRSALAAGYNLHVHENREAARGGNGAAGGGCGCN